MRQAFLDISIAFNRVWHDGLLFKLKQNGVSGNLIGLVKSFLVLGFKESLLMEKLLIGNVYEQLYHKDLF